MSGKPKIAIIMGSKSDEPAMQKCLDVLQEFDVGFTCSVFSAHRTPKKVAALARNARAEGVKVIIAAAGLAAALPGVIAAHTTLPVIGVPMASGPLNGKDALYSIVQMPPGIPVATVGIGNAKNAAYLALSILSIVDENVSKKLQAFRESYGDE